MDQIDLQILAELTHDGRISRHDLSAKLSLSREVVSRRLNALLSGSGRRVVGVVHPSVLGEVVMAHVMIDVSSPAEIVANAIAKEAGVPFVSLVIGPMALTAEVRVPSRTELFLVMSRIRGTQGVVRAELSLYEELLVDVLPQAPFTFHQPDAVDLALINSLRQDGRMSYSALAASAGTSIGTARTRTMKLLERGVVRIGIIDDTEPPIGHLRVGAGIKVKGPLLSVGETFAALQSVTFLATSSGRFDIVATLESTAATAVGASLDRLRSHPNVLSCETWAHFQVFKEQH